MKNFGKNSPRLRAFDRLAREKEVSRYRQELALQWLFDLTSAGPQDEETSVVFGMPHEAIRQGGVDKILPLDSIATEVIKKPTGTEHGRINPTGALLQTKTPGKLCNDNRF